MKQINLKVKSVLMLVCAFCVMSCTEESETRVEPLYKDVPNIKNCSHGEISDMEKEKVLASVNKIRIANNLPEVQYNQDSRTNREAQAAALVCAANGTILTFPSQNDNCYTPDGALGCNESIISLWGSSSSKWPTSEFHINDFMIEKGMETINRRRTILDPFLTRIAFGRVIGTPKSGDYKYVSVAALSPKQNSNPDLSEKELPDFIAFPRGACDSKFFDQDMFLSFSVLSNKVVKADNRADFSDVKVEVLSGAQSITVIEIKYDNDTKYGLPNNLQWRLDKLSRNVTYSVKISNVLVQGESRDYEYTFSFK